MNSLAFSIAARWVEMILDGRKKFELHAFDCLR